MNTLYDFMTAALGTQYILALAFIAGYVVLIEVLNQPRPFAKLASELSKDIAFVRETSAHTDLLRKLVQVPVVAVMYLAAVPVLFAQGLAGSAVRTVAAGASYGWSPIRAYFAGKKSSKKKDSGK